MKWPAFYKEDLFLRRIFILALDFVSILLAFWFVSFSLRGIPGGVKALSVWIILGLTVFNLMIYAVSGLYGSLWLYTGTREIIQIALTTLAASGADLMIGLLIQNRLRYIQYAFIWLTLFTFAFMVRQSYRLLRYVRDWFSAKSRRSHRRLLVIGADDTGSNLILKLLHGHLNFGTPIVVLDENHLKWGKRIHGIKVFGGIDKLGQVIRIFSIDEVIIATPYIDSEKIQVVDETAKACGCLVRMTILDQLSSAKGERFQLRNLNLEDLLGSQSIYMNADAIEKLVAQQTVLIVGSGGEIAEALCPKLALYHPQKIVLFNMGETPMIHLKKMIEQQFMGLVDVVIEIGSVLDQSALRRLYQVHQPTIVFHLAAYCSPTLVEGNPKEAIKQHLFATKNVIELGLASGVTHVVHFSSDLAVNCQTVMGQTQFLADQFIFACAKKHPDRVLTSIRFGDILGAVTSETHAICEQIEQRQTVFLTKPKMGRRFIKVDDVVTLALNTMALADRGSAYYLKGGRVVSLEDFTLSMIRFYGLTPYADIKIETAEDAESEKYLVDLEDIDRQTETTNHPMIVRFLSQYVPDMAQIQALFNEAETLLDGDEQSLRQFLLKACRDFKWRPK